MAEWNDDIFEIVTINVFFTKYFKNLYTLE